MREAKECQKKKRGIAIITIYKINKRMRENKIKTHNIVYLVQSNNDPSLKERAALGSSS
jgi:hypothetical protein